MSDRVTGMYAAGYDAALKRITELEAEITRLAQERDALKAEIAAAREACPAVRMQDYADAPLLALVNEEISQLFRMQARAEKAEQERDALQTELAGWKATFETEDKLMQQQTRLIEERDALQEKFDYFAKLASEHRDELEAKQARLIEERDALRLSAQIEAQAYTELLVTKTRLVEALRQYGQHDETCWLSKDAELDVKCTCGLTAAVEDALK